MANSRLCDFFLVLFCAVQEEVIDPEKPHWNLTFASNSATKVSHTIQLIQAWEEEGCGAKGTKGKRHLWFF